MKFDKGNKVRIKKDLQVGMEYSNEDGTIFDVCSFRMKNNFGREALIVGIEEGKYRLNIDRFFLYTDNMLESIDKANPKSKSGKGIIDVNEETENIVQEMLKSIPEQLINDAIDNGDVERLKNLSQILFNDEDTNAS